MKQILKNETGAVVIVVILVIILAVGAGGATFLGVRMAIDGGDFLQPFEDLGWISSDDDDDTDKAKSNKINEDIDDDDEKDDDNVASSEEELGVVASRLSAEAKKSDVVHYYGKMTLAESTFADGVDEELAKLYDLLKLEVNLYVENNEMVEIVFSVYMKEYLEGAYELYKDELSESGYESYEDFEEEMLPVFESAFDFGFEEALNNSDTDIGNYVNKYVEDGNIQVYITKEGFASLYENYDIDPDETDVEKVIQSIEDAIGIKINKVD